MWQANLKYKIIFTIAALLLSSAAYCYDITPYLNLYGGYTGEVVGNVHGGIYTGCTYDGLFDLGLEFTTDSVCKKWKGATFNLLIESAHGNDPMDMIGDIQGTSNIAIGNNPIFLAKLYYAQEIGPVKIIVGLQDMNDEYDCLESAMDFINSSWSLSPLFANVFSLPSYPNTALGLDIKWNITPMWAWQAAVYDTPYPLDEDINPYNVRWKFTSEKGCQVMTEFHCTPTFKGDLDGAYKIGASYQTETQRWGINCNIEQAVLSTERHKLYVLAKGGYMPWLGGMEGYSHAALGLSLYGVFSKHMRDYAGLGFTTAIYKFNETLNQETAFELTYKYTLFDHLYFQPDFQFILSPNLILTDIPNAVVLMLRFGAYF